MTASTRANGKRGGTTDAAMEAAPRLFDGPGEMRARCRALDWAATPLGRVERWPAALRTVAGLVLGAPTPMIVLWGPELAQIYNDGYRDVMGTKDPAGLGQPTRECWPEVWEFNAPIYAGVLERGESFTFSDQRLVIDRHGEPEAAFFTLTYSPVSDDAGAVGGVLVTVFETTAQVRARDAREVERERLLATECAARQEAERRAAELLAVIESIPDAVYIGSVDGITLANQTALDQLGFGAREALNRYIGTLAEEIRTRDAGTGEFIPVERQAFARALGGERVVQDVLVRHRVTGEERVVRCAAAPVEVEGRVIAAVAVNTDVTAARAAVAERERLAADAERARRQAQAAEAAERVAREHLERVITQAPVAMYIARGREHLFEVVNAAWCRITGKRPEEVLGRPFREVFPELAPQGIVEVIERVYDTGEPLVTPAMRAVMDTDGDGEPEEHFFNVVYQPLRDAAGAVYATALVATEVTELAQARRAAERAQAAAEAASRAKSDFLAVMSHELRTPLNAIGGYAELIELGIRGPVTEQQRADLARIQASQRHLLGLIAGVLDYSRVEAGAVTYRLVGVPVADAVAEAEALVAPQLRAKGLGYAWSGAPSGLCVRADREKLQQILLNLLGNAVKFTAARDGAAGRLEVACTVEDDRRDGAPGGRVRLHVRDTGEGIAPEQLERVFEPFVQADQRLTRPHAGVGLGLAISRDLARGMGGDLTAESAPGVGSTFTLTLPRA